MIGLYVRQWNLKPFPFSYSVILSKMLTVWKLRLRKMSKVGVGEHRQEIGGWSCDGEGQSLDLKV